MDIPGFTGTRSMPMTRGVLPRTPFYRPSVGFTGMKAVPALRTTASRPIYLAGDFGRGRIADTVRKKGDPANQPVRRRVRCIRERDGRVMGETWSDPVTGAYAFEQLVVTERYTVVAYDHEHGFRAAIADNLTPVVP